MSVDNQNRTRLRRLTKRLGDLPTAVLTWFFTDTAALYDVLGTQPGTGNFLNLGWWENTDALEVVDEETITEACRELVRQFAAFGSVSSRDEILDVGFGFAQQDVLLGREFDCRDITGLNITPHQVRKGRKLVEENGFSNRISLQLGDAVALPFEENTFDRVFALETAFHFHTRNDFLEEARRVLKPGGTIMLADIINGPEEGSDLLSSFVARAHENYWNIPPANRINRIEYADTLAEKGYRSIEIEDVSDHVLTPWVRNYLHWRLEQQSWPLNVLGRPGVQFLLKFYEEDYFEYVFARAEVP